MVPLLLHWRQSDGVVVSVDMLDTLVANAPAVFGAPLVDLGVEDVCATVDAHVMFGAVMVVFDTVQLASDLIHANNRFLFFGHRVLHRNPRSAN